MLIFISLIKLAFSTWEYYQIKGSDTKFNFCQYYNEPCSSPDSFPFPRHSSTSVLYTSWTIDDINNLCEGTECGPLCDYKKPSCFVDFRNPKDPNDSTKGGRGDLPTPSGVTTAIGNVSVSWCPTSCCNTENCLRTHDVVGYPVNATEEYILVFGGVSWRNVTVNGEILYDTCTDNLEAALKKGYSVNFVNPCGGQLLNEIWRYNIKRNTWEYLKPTINLSKISTYLSPYPRFGHSSVYIELLVNDTYTTTKVTRKYMYIYGGFALECMDACSDLWRYEIPWAGQRYYPEPSSNSEYWNRGDTWENLTTIVNPGGRTKHNMVASPDNDYIYLFGGYGNQTFYNDLWRWDIEDGSWGNMQTFGINKVTRTLNLRDGGTYQLLIDEDQRKTTDYLEYSSNDNIPQARSSSCMIYFRSHEDYLLLFGGWGLRTQPYGTMTIGVALDDFWAYSIKNKKWTRIYSNDTGPSPRIEASMIQLDTSRVLLYGGRRQDTTYNDVWVYNLDTNHWFNWTDLLIDQAEIYPKGSYRGNLVLTSKGIFTYGGNYINAVNMSFMDANNSAYKNYLQECSSTLTLYNLTISDLKNTNLAEKLYNQTNNTCFSGVAFPPEYEKHVEFIQGVWFLNLTTCMNNCSGKGDCYYSTCICDIGYYGEFCQYQSCPGSLCYYDNEFFTISECLHCSGNGECNNGTCSCNSGYLGEDCSVTDCQTNCSKGGNCVEMYPISQCDCNGKNGDDQCSVTFCLNTCNEPNGACNLTLGECTCNDGFYGLDCSVQAIQSWGRFLEISFIFLTIFSYF